MPATKQENPLLRRIVKGLAVIGGLGALILAPSIMPKEAPDFTWNFSASVPIGLYKRVDKRDVDLKLFRQDPVYVTFCLPENLKDTSFYGRFCSPTSPHKTQILKRLVAEQTSGGWIVEGDIDAGIDSKLIGPVEIAQIRGFWRPILTWGPGQ
jgi:type IV secretory pathway protease TraF